MRAIRRTVTVSEIQVTDVETGKDILNESREGTVTKGDIVDELFSDKEFIPVTIKIEEKEQKRIMSADDYMKYSEVIEQPTEKGSDK